MDYIALAIPAFVILIAVELAVDAVTRRHTYRLNDTITSLNLGILSRIIEIFLLMIPFSIYTYTYQYWSLVQWSYSDSWYWIITFIIYDFAYYWLHRFNHEVNVLWGSHVVHHSSEEYNLTTALRQTSTPSLLAWLLFIPMSVLGIDPLVFAATASFNLIYQFWVHTQHVNKLPKWFESIFVTPSHHRVHHAQNSEYIDKNYGGVFITWDKLFGTFKAEVDAIEPIYGVRRALKSWNPVWANFQVYWSLVRDSWLAKNWKDKLYVFFAPTGWRPKDVAISYPITKTIPDIKNKFLVDLPKSFQCYLVIQQLLFMTAVVWLLLNAVNLEQNQQIALGLLAVGNIYVLSTLQHQHAWANLCELARLIFSCAMILPYLPSLSNQVALLATALTSMLFYLAIEGKGSDAKVGDSDI